MQQHCTDDTGAEYPICTRSLRAFMRCAVGKNCPHISPHSDSDPIHLEGYIAGTGARWLLDCGHFSECLSVIANAEWRECLESPT